MKARLVRIGNSRGIRLPKTLIEELSFEAEVELRVREGAIEIRPANDPRAGWEDAAREAHRNDDDHPVIPELEHASFTLTLRADFVADPAKETASNSE